MTLRSSATVASRGASPGTRPGRAISAMSSLLKVGCASAERTLPGILCRDRARHNWGKPYCRGLSGRGAALGGRGPGGEPRLHQLPHGVHFELFHELRTMGPARLDAVAAEPGSLPA